MDSRGQNFLESHLEAVPELSQIIEYLYLIDWLTTCTSKDWCWRFGSVQTRQQITLRTRVIHRYDSVETFTLYRLLSRNGRNKKIHLRIRNILFINKKCCWTIKGCSFVLHLLCLPKVCGVEEDREAQFDLQSTLLAILQCLDQVPIFILWLHRVSWLDSAGCWYFQFFDVFFLFALRLPALRVFTQKSAFVSHHILIFTTVDYLWLIN